jgi:hypothetical protein
MRNKKWYVTKTISFEKLIKLLNDSEFDDIYSSWVFRGQKADSELKTSLERGCEKSELPPTEAEHIEEMIIREFKRLYNGEDHEEVISDNLYCMSLLRHFGAPTRCLDFSYSKYVGLYFGLKAAYDNMDINKEKTSFAVWCVDVKDMNRRSKNLYKSDPLFLDAYQGRYSVKSRTDETFEALYRSNKYEMVISENPVRIHNRLHIQQGILLCQGRLDKSFMENLHHLYDSSGTKKIKKYVCKLTKSELKKAFDSLLKMNITEESLFPGLDGLARSVGYKLGFYKELYYKICDEGGLP